MYLVVQLIVVALVAWNTRDALLTTCVFGLMLVGNAILMKSLLGRAGRQVAGKRHRKVLTKAILRRLGEYTIGLTAAEEKLHELRTDTLRLIAHCVADGLGTTPADCIATLWLPPRPMLTTGPPDEPPLAAEDRAIREWDGARVALSTGPQCSILIMPLTARDDEPHWCVSVLIYGRVLQLSDEERSLWQTTLWPYVELLGLTLQGVHPPLD